MTTRAYDTGWNAALDRVEELLRTWDASQVIRDVVANQRKAVPVKPPRSRCAICGHYGQCLDEDDPDIWHTHPCAPCRKCNDADEARDAANAPTTREDQQ